MSDPVPHLRGANLDLILTLVSAGIPDDLTGLTISKFEINPTGLNSSFVMNILDQTILENKGRISVVCPWSTSWPAGTGILVSFRAQLSDGSAVPQISVELM